MSTEAKLREALAAELAASVDLVDACRDPRCAELRVVIVRAERANAMANAALLMPPDPNPLSPIRQALGLAETATGEECAAAARMAIHTIDHEQEYGTQMTRERDGLRIEMSKIIERMEVDLDRTRKALAKAEAGYCAAAKDNERLRKALAPFAEFYQRMKVSGCGDYTYMSERVKDWLGVSDFAAAHAALSASPQPTPATAPIDGVGLIAVERRRQVEKEGWTPEHDDTEHLYGDLTQAAVSYAQNAICQIQRSDYPRPISWPWKFAWWKPSADPIRNLVKAGALIAAEIDRLKRAAPATDSPARPCPSPGSQQSAQPESAGQYDASNLRFYAQLFEQHRWETPELSWTVFHQTLNKVAERIEGYRAELAREKAAREAAEVELANVTRNRDQLAAISDKQRTELAELRPLVLRDAEKEAERLRGELADTTAVMERYAAESDKFCKDAEVTRGELAALREDAANVLEPFAAYKKVLIDWQHGDGLLLTSYVDEHKSGIRVRHIIDAAALHARLTAKEPKV